MISTNLVDIICGICFISTNIVVVELNLCRDMHAGKLERKVQRQKLQSCSLTLIYELIRNSDLIVVVAIFCVYFS